MGIVDEVNFESGSPSICIEGEWYYVCYYHHHSIVFDDDELSELIGQTIMYTFDCNGNVVIVKKIELKDFTHVSRVTGVNWIQVDFEGGPLDGTVNIFSDSVNNEFHDYTTFFVDVEDSNGELSIIGGRRAGTRGDGLIAEVEFVPESAGYVRGEVYEINQFVAIDAKTKSIYRIWYDGSPEVFMAEVEALEGDPGSSTSKFVVRFLIDDKVYRHVAVKKGDTVDKPDDPQLNVFGATFEGWHLQDSWDEYDFSQPITHNMKLYGSFAFSEFPNSIYNSCVLNVTSGDTNVMISNELIEVDFEDERSIVKNKEELYGLNGACIVYEDPNWSDREKLLIISKIDSNDINSAMNVYDIMESNIYKDSSRRNLLPIVYMNGINGETVIFDPAGEYYQKNYTIVQASWGALSHGTEDMEPVYDYGFCGSQCDGIIGIIYASFNIGSRVIIDEGNEILYIIDETEKPDPSGEDELGENSGDPYVEPSYPDEDESGEPYLKPGENSGDPYVELNSSGDCVLPELANTAYNAFLLKQYENDYVELDNNWFEVDFDNNPVISNSSEFLPLSLYSPCIVYDEAYLMSDNKVRFVDSLSFNEMNDGIIVNRINTLSNGSQEVIAYSMAGTMRKLFW